jgi:hypothetical protein
MNLKPFNSSEAQNNSFIILENQSDAKRILEKTVYLNGASLL